MIEGWLLDVHEHASSTGMVVWVVDDVGQAHRCDVAWNLSLHVHGTLADLDALEHWLQQPEIQARFTLRRIQRRQHRLDLERHDRSTVLELELERALHLRRLAEHIEARGQFHRFTLYSVDAHLAQRFLNDMSCVPFQRVCWTPEDGGHLEPVEREVTASMFPPFRVVRLTVKGELPPGLPSGQDAIVSIDLVSEIQQGVALPREHHPPIHLQREDYASMEEMLHQFHSSLQRLDPDILLTHGGDQRLFPWLLAQARAHGVNLVLGRTTTPLSRSTSSRTVHSYGQTLHKHGAYFLEGRLHLDTANSFILSEGGVAGLFELAQQSCQSAQIISRLSPGSVISAIQMRVAMDDGVLVPWKKNRPEDTKTALELLNADRGGLYLDSAAGVHASVVELDFASLFPSIIATRNISPETLNCSCCQPSGGASNQFVPLHPDEARREFRQRGLSTTYGHGLFPLSNPASLQVPGLHTHTCGRTHGFLGRVVAPLIERRRQLKMQRQTKGDAFDLRQNALKWLLVTCFGYTGYRNARFGRIEAHEAICAWSRDLLLTTIHEAQQRGWTVLHAIVDCVWLVDQTGERSSERVVSDAHEFAQTISQMVGIPLEFEAFYPFIAFLPSRQHGAGSLTKYWAYDGRDFKVRGIEMRQRSTPTWVKQLQQQALSLLVPHDTAPGLPSVSLQGAVLKHYRSQLQRLQGNDVPLTDLVITRRITKTLEEYRVRNVAYGALQRARRLGSDVPPGGKIRYVVLDESASEPSQRVMLAEELGVVHSEQKPCLSFYQRLAERAIWAVLAPFGWTTEDLRRLGVQPTLLEFTSPRTEA